MLQPGTKAGTSSAKISREHTTASPTPGLTVIAGGKLTTYRVMATDAVDFALGDRAGDLPSITDRIPLVGAVGLEALGRRATVVARTYGWSGQTVDHLLHRYGSLLGDLVDAIADRPDLARPLEHAPAYLRAEIAYAATHEGVLHLEDVMLHRTRLNYEMRDRGLAALPEIATLTGEILEWSPERVAAEMAGYTERARAEADAEHQPDDSTAETVRLRAADIAPLRTLTAYLKPWTVPRSSARLLGVEAARPRDHASVDPPSPNWALWPGRARATPARRPDRESENKKL